MAADLFANTFALSNPTVAPGGRLTFSYIVSNIGSSSAGSSFAGIYWSIDGVITTADNLVVVRTTPFLGSGLVSLDNTGFWDVPSNFAPGTYSIGA